MAKRKLVVKTDVGTFTRTTARTYTHIVIVSRYTDAQLAKMDAVYSEGNAWWTAKKAEDAAGTWRELGWAGRLDLAVKVATGVYASHYQHVRIVDVKTGALLSRFGVAISDDAAQRSAADHAEALRLCTGSVAVTVTDGDATATALAPGMITLADYNARFEAITEAHRTGKLTPAESSAAMKELTSLRIAHGVATRSAGRPTIGKRARVHMTLRVDPDLIDTIKQLADARGIGYQQLMHQMLAAAVKAGGAL